MPARCIDHPLTVSYVRLVHAIAPFHGLFVESHLKGMPLQLPPLYLPDVLKDTVTHLLRSVEGISLPPLSISPPFISTRSIHTTQIVFVLFSLSRKSTVSFPHLPSCTESSVIQLSRTDHSQGNKITDRIRSFPARKREREHF